MLLYFVWCMCVRFGRAHERTDGRMSGCVRACVPKHFRVAFMRSSIHPSIHESKVFLDLVVALQPATPLANPQLAEDVGMEALAPIAASVARQFAAAHRMLYKNFNSVRKPVSV